MLCDRCKKNIASNFYTQNINGKIYKYYLCNECVKNLTNINFFLDDLLGNFISSNISFNNQNQISDDSKNCCSKCGSTFEDIIKSGKVGCDNCYYQFRDMLLPTIKKLHANTKHIGNIPKSVSSTTLSQISMLKLKLETAIKNQEFEEAAKLRDQINELKKAGENDDKHI